MNKKEYVVVKYYCGNFDGYLWIAEKYHEYTYQLNNATLLTLKQANSFVFKANQEAKRNHSYSYRYGYLKVK